MTKRYLKNGRMRVLRNLSFAILGELCGYILTAKAAKEREGCF